MMLRDKAIVLLDEVRGMEYLAERLSSRFSIDEIQELYASFLFDLLRQLISLPSMAIFLFTENYLDRNRWFGAFGGKAELRLFPSAAEVTLHIAESLFSEGYRRLLFLKSRNPIAPMREIQFAFHLLELQDDIVVVGPTESRGWYLAGIKSLHGPFLKELDARPAAYYDDVLKAICKLDAMTFPLQARYDVVSVSDLESLRKDIELRITEKQPIPQKTMEQFFHQEHKFSL